MSKWPKHISSILISGFCLKYSTCALSCSRKPFEYDVGTFKGSVNPDVSNFREFPRYLNKLNKKKPIAMFCTGGIRCEKASVFLKKKGFKNVYNRRKKRFANINIIYINFNNWYIF